MQNCTPILNLYYSAKVPNDKTCGALTPIQTWMMRISSNTIL